MLFQGTELIPHLVAGGGPPLSPRGEVAEDLGVVWGLGCCLELTIPEPEIQGLTSACPEQPLGIGAALRNCGLRKTHPEPEHCPGIRCFLAERNSRESQQRLLLRSICWA